MSAMNNMRIYLSEKIIMRKQGIVICVTCVLHYIPIDWIFFYQK